VVLSRIFFEMNGLIAIFEGVIKPVNIKHRHCEHCELGERVVRSNLNHYKQYKPSKEIASRKHTISPVGFAMTK
jgi:hypothetical protein